MTEFKVKPGDTVRRVRATFTDEGRVGHNRMPVGAEAKVLSVHPRNGGLGLEGWGDGHTAAKFELVTPATPAPLDPSKVKAGDTVTLERGGALVRDVVAIADHYADGSQRLLTSEPPVQAYRVGPGAWTLTAHQPAPEPEPEWEPGDMAAVTARGWLNGWSVRTAANDGWASHSDSDDVRSDAEVESVRPLVVIDPADVDVDALEAEFRDEPVRLLLERLGIEVPRA